MAKTKESKDEKFCTTCGAKIHQDAELCPKCGVRQPTHKETKKGEGEKEVWIAVLASVIVPGLGQLYTNQSFGKAALIFCTSWLIIPYFYGIYDAYREVKKIRGEN